MSTPEGKVKVEICSYLDSLAQCWYFKPIMMGYGRKGIPDIIGCFRGFFFAIEVKAPGKIHNTTPWQDKECEDIASAGGAAMVVDSVQAVQEMFQLKSVH